MTTTGNTTDREHHLAALARKYQLLTATRNMGATFARLEHAGAVSNQAMQDAYGALTGPDETELRDAFRLGYFRAQDDINATR